MALLIPFHEDASRIHKDNSPENMVTLRHTEKSSLGYGLSKPSSFPLIFMRLPCNKLGTKVFGGGMVGNDGGGGLFGVELFAFIHVEIEAIAPQ